MPLQKITLKPGVNRMLSPTANEGGWSDSNRIRFRQGLPEKLRGWRRYMSQALQGVPRALQTFWSLAGDMLLGVGTHNHLYLLRGGVQYDITPVDRTVAVNAGGVATSAGSAVVTITAAAPHGLGVGDFVTFDTITGQVRAAAALTVGGLSLGSQDFAVASVVSANAVTITAGSAATGTASSGGAATLTCYMAAGPQHATAGLGWGAGGWGVSGWGQPASVAADLLPPRLWSIEAWGQTLLGVPTRGRLVSWSPDSSGNVSTRAAYVVNGANAANGPPRIIGGMCVGMPERHVLLFGCSALNSIDGTTYDPLLVRWSDVEDYSTYNALATNSAGSFRLQSGSKIVGWYNTTLQTLIWTDTSMWAMRFVGMPYVYSFQKMDGNCGLIAQGARVDLGGVFYWMGPTGFWQFRGGAPDILPCTLQDTVFLDINQAQRGKIFCATNSLDGEVTWFYPSAASLEVDRYVTYNVREDCWYAGALARTAMIDRGTLDYPLAADPTGLLFEHEVGNDADGAAMGEYLESGWFDLEDGEHMMLVSSIIPDFQDLTGEVRITVKVTDYPNKAPRVLGPYTITPSTRFVNFRARGRQASLRIEGNGLGRWRFGMVRANIQSDGMR